MMFITSILIFCLIFSVWPAFAEDKQEDMREIPITGFDNIRIGQVENAEAATGCTVLICEEGMPAGMDVRGGGPASRESQLLNPLMAAQSIHAIVLAGARIGKKTGSFSMRTIIKEVERKKEQEKYK